MAKGSEKRRQSASREGAKQQPSRNAVREQKRAEFSGEQKRSPLVWLVPLAIVAIAAVVGVVLVSGGKTDAHAYAAPPASAQGGDVTIPVADVNDGAVHFFASDVNGTQVKYFVVKASDGSLRVAFDACEVCYRAKKGYTQVGDSVRCNNCGRVFASDSIGVERGGCNPSPIEATTAGGKLTIPFSQVETGTQFFQ
jgi:uncharacterized membrane protein